MVKPGSPWVSEARRAATDEVQPRRPFRDDDDRLAVVAGLASVRRCARLFCHRRVSGGADPAARDVGQRIRLRAPASLPQRIPLPWLLALPPSRRAARHTGARATEVGPAGPGAPDREPVVGATPVVSAVGRCGRAEPDPTALHGRLRRRGPRRISLRAGAPLGDLDQQLVAVVRVIAGHVVQSRDRVSGAALAGGHQLRDGDAGARLPLAR